jgi:hypothetical protein
MEVRSPGGVAGGPSHGIEAFFRMHAFITEARWVIVRSLGDPVKEKPKCRLLPLL